MKFAFINKISVSAVKEWNIIWLISFRCLLWIPCSFFAGKNTLANGSVFFSNLIRFNYIINVHFIWVFCFVFETIEKHYIQLVFNEVLFIKKRDCYFMDNNYFSKNYKHDRNHVILFTMIFLRLLLKQYF